MLDEQIIELFWKRSEKAISALDGKYGKVLHNLSYNILNDRWIVCFRNLYAVGCIRVNAYFLGKFMNKNTYKIIAIIAMIISVIGLVSFFGGIRSVNIGAFIFRF